MVVIFTLILCLLILLSFIYHISRRKFNYWQKRNVPFLKPLTFFGNYKDYILMKVYPSTVTAEICKQFPDAPYVGVYYGTEPALVVKDPELVKLITTKDFDYFHGREISDHTHKEVVTQNIFFTDGERWKILRHNLTPLYSSTKLKNMFYLVKKCATDLESMLEREVKVASTLDTRVLASRYTIDVVTLCAFGINADVMGEEVELNPFKIIGQKTLSASLANGLRVCIRSMWPRIFYALGFQVFSKEVNDFFTKLLTEVFESRKYKPSSRHDFVDLILDLYQQKFITNESLNNDKKKFEIEVNEGFLVGQCVAFFAGGFETSAGAFTSVLYEFAKYEHIQKRAIAEVDAYLLRHKGDVEYDIISEVPYLEACLDEALRLHPLLSSLTRETMEEYTLPDGLVLEKGLRIHIPVVYFHLSPDHFSNPDEYDPERFLGERKKDVNTYTYFPFGAGPRLCIGMRFAKLIILTGLVTVLKQYTVKLADGTPLKLHDNPRAIVGQPIEQINLTFTRRN